MAGAPGYKARKAAQVTAFFALKAGGSINILKVVKLLYLAEREFMDRYDEPMFYDRFVSMEHGPVPSTTLSLVDGCIEDAEWSEYISGRSDYLVGVANDSISYESLDELSRADEEVLNFLWDKFGDFDGFTLRDYTHEHCPEWEDPNGSSRPITHESVFRFLNKENGAELSKDIDEYRRLASILLASA